MPKTILPGIQWRSQSSEIREIPRKPDELKIQVRIVLSGKVQDAHPLHPPYPSTRRTLFASEQSRSPPGGLPGAERLNEHAAASERALSSYFFRTSFSPQHISFEGAPFSQPVPLTSMWSSSAKVSVTS